MNRKNLAGLVVVNFALLVVLGVLCLTPDTAQGQLGAGRGDYMMVAGQAKGQTAGVLWVVDTVSGRLVVVGYDRGQRALRALAGREMMQDAIGGGQP